MWKDTLNNVNKVFWVGYKNESQPEPVEVSSTYPHTDYNKLLKYGQLETYKNYSHIHTCNSSNNFSI